MSNTPRTDAEQEDAVTFAVAGGMNDVRAWELARELEREIAQLKQWNQDRAGRFAVTEGLLARQVAKLRLALEEIQIAAQWSGKSGPFHAKSLEDAWKKFERIESMATTVLQRDEAIHG